MIRAEFWAIFALLILATVCPTILVFYLTWSLTHRINLMMRTISDSMTETDTISEEHGKDGDA